MYSSPVKKWQDTERKQHAYVGISHLLFIFITFYAAILHTQCIHFLYGLVKAMHWISAMLILGCVVLHGIYSQITTALFFPLIVLEMTLHPLPDLYIGHL